jgi:hypothetical protein
LVEEHAAGKVDQYQSKGRPQWQVCHLPITGRLEKIVIGWVRGKFCFLDDGTGGYDFHNLGEHQGIVG